VPWAMLSMAAGVRGTAECGGSADNLSDFVITHRRTSQRTIFGPEARGFVLSSKHNYRLNVNDPVGGFLPGVVRVA